jgi:Na+-driven multidrug efflux pump
MSAATALWTVLIYFAPVHLITDILGPTWPKARQLVLYIGAGYVLSAMSGASNAGLRALRASKENLWLAVATLPFLFIPCLGGAARWGARGFAIGMIVAVGVYTAFSWIVLVRTAARYEVSGVLDLPVLHDWSAGATGELSSGPPQEVAEH